MKWESLKAQIDAEKSHPARGAWIEMVHKVKIVAAGGVAPRKGCVD